jgi:hypothetical protein
VAFLELDEVFTAPLRESEQFRRTFAEAASELARAGPLGAASSAL